MGRSSLRTQRRTEIARAFARTLAAHGAGGATIAAVAASAGVAPGLVHHHFESKQDLYGALLDELLATFRRRLDAVPAGDPIDAYVTAALALGDGSDTVTARAWVGLFAEALTEPTLFARMRRILDGEVARVERRSAGALGEADCSAIVAFVLGALVFGAFAPRKAAGFAAPSLRRMIGGLRRAGRP
jgi:TetR/AcrR family transcriptional repressor of bet genes